MSTSDPEDFKIVLNPSPGEGEQQLVYHPGSEVTGSLFLKMNSPQQFDDIVINLRGEGHVSWTKTTVHITPSNGISNFYTTEAVRKANKLYVNLTKTLWSKSESGESDGSLPPGEHSFPFRFMLPLRIPSSHDSTVQIPGQLVWGDKGSGWTRYSLHAHMNRGHSRTDHVHTEMRLTIKELVDVSLPKLQLPVDMQVRKTAGCCFSCISGTVVATLVLPKTGFCVDEDIPYRITIENGGSHPVEATATLEEHIVYHTRFRKCYPKETVHGTVNNGPVQPGETTTLTPEVQVLKIPASVITIMNSTIIKQSFLLKVKVRVPNVIFNPILTCPLVISNGMPLQQEEAVTLPEEVTLQPSMEAGEVTPFSNPAPSSSPIPPTSSINQLAPSNIPLKKVGDSRANSGASVLVTTEPPSYHDAIKKV